MNARLRTEAPSLVLIVTMFAMAGVTWSGAPDRIPLHWNDAGQVDRYGGRAEGLLLLPIVAAGLYVLLLILALIDPRETADPFSGFPLFFRTALTGLLFTVYVAVHLWIRGLAVDMTSFVLCSVGVIAVLAIGSFLVSRRASS